MVKKAFPNHPPEWETREANTANRKDNTMESMLLLAPKMTKIIMTKIIKNNRRANTAIRM